jgi:hypothetical protein
MADLAVAAVAFAFLGLGLGVPFLIDGRAAANVVAFLELPCAVAANVTLVGAGIDQLARHETLPY